MVFLLLLCLLLVFVAIWIYRKGHENRYYFKEREIPYMEPQFIFGSAGQMLKKSLMEMTAEITRDLPDAR